RSHWPGLFCLVRATLSFPNSGLQPTVLTGVRFVGMASARWKRQTPPRLISGVSSAGSPAFEFSDSPSQWAARHTRGAERCRVSDCWFPRRRGSSNLARAWAGPDGCRVSIGPRRWLFSVPVYAAYFAGVLSVGLPWEELGDKH